MTFQTNYGLQTTPKHFPNLRVYCFKERQQNNAAHCGAKKEHVSNHPALCAFYSLALISRGVAPGCHTVALSGL
jgi:hypothetical protein